VVFIYEVRKMKKLIVILLLLLPACQSAPTYDVPELSAKVVGRYMFYVTQDGTLMEEERQHRILEAHLLLKGIRQIVRGSDL
jgi:hypothetical protein